MIKASCADNVEDIDDLWTLYEVHFSVNDCGETIGVLCGQVCKKCFDKAIKEGYGYRTKEDCWKAIEEIDK